MALSRRGRFLVNAPSRAGRRVPFRAPDANLRICQKTGDVNGEHQARHNLGILHARLREIQKATRYHERDAESCQQTGNVVGEAKACLTVGMLFLQNQQTRICEFGKGERGWLRVFQPHLRWCRVANPH